MSNHLTLSRWMFAICSLALGIIPAMLFLTTEGGIPFCFFIVIAIPFIAFAALFCLSPRFHNFRLFWIAAIVVSLGTTYIFFAGHVVNTDSLKQTSADFSNPSPIPIYLWQKPWLIHRIYSQFYQELRDDSIDTQSKSLTLIVTILSIGLPLTIGLSLYRVWIPLKI